MFGESFVAGLFAEELERRLSILRWGEGGGKGGRERVGDLFFTSTKWGLRRIMLAVFGSEKGEGGYMLFRDLAGVVEFPFVQEEKGR